MIPQAATPTTASDEDLLRSLQAGERDALETVFVKYRADIYNLCARIVGDREEAQDLTQEVFIKAFAARPSDEEDSRCGRGSIALPPTRASTTCAPAAIVAMQAKTASKACRDVDEYEQAQTVALVEGALSTMNERYRTALVLKDLHGSRPSRSRASWACRAAMPTCSCTAPAAPSNTPSRARRRRGTTAPGASGWCWRRWRCPRPAGHVDRRGPHDCRRRAERSRHRTGGCRIAGDRGSRGIAGSHRFPECLHSLARHVCRPADEALRRHRGESGGHDRRSSAPRRRRRGRGRDDVARPRRDRPRGGRGGSGALAPIGAHDPLAGTPCTGPTMASWEKAGPPRFRRARIRTGHAGAAGHDTLAGDAPGDAAAPSRPRRGVPADGDRNPVAATPVLTAAARSGRRGFRLRSHERRPERTGAGHTGE